MHKYRKTDILYLIAADLPFYLILNIYLFVHL